MTYRRLAKWDSMTFEEGATLEKERVAAEKLRLEKAYEMRMREKQEWDALPAIHRLAQTLACVDDSMVEIMVDTKLLRDILAILEAVDELGQLTAGK